MAKYTKLACPVCRIRWGRPFGSDTQLGGVCGICRVNYYKFGYQFGSVAAWAGARARHYYLRSAIIPKKPLKR